MPTSTVKAGKKERKSNMADETNTNTPKTPENKAPESKAPESKAAAPIASRGLPCQCGEDLSLHAKDPPHGCEKSKCGGFSLIPIHNR